MCSHISLALLVAAPTSLAINVQPSVRSIGSFATSTPFPSLAVQKGPTRIFDVLAPLERLAAQYEQLMDNHYLSLSAAQAGTLRGTADVLSQCLRHQGTDIPIDLVHSASIVFLGIFLSGFGGAAWLRHLENKMGPSTDTGDVVKKAAIDYTCWAPIANTAYLFFVPLLTGMDLDTAVHSAQAGFLSVMLLELSIFAPYNCYAFSKVPPPLRPPIQALLSMIFTLVLSALC